MRARDISEALDLPIPERLATRGILTEPEPGLFTQPRP